jgi:hypothetical protein
VQRLVDQGGDADADDGRVRAEPTGGVRDDRRSPAPSAATRPAISWPSTTGGSTFDGPQAESEAALVDDTRTAIEGGARGVVYGRNVWQADDPAAISARIREIVHGCPAPNRRAMLVARA